MSSGEESYNYKPCQKCGDPVDEGSIGTKHNMCFECVQKTYGITEAGSSSGTKPRKSADAHGSGATGVSPADGNESALGANTDGQNEVVDSEENQDISSKEGHVGEDDNNKGKGRGAGASILVADNDEQKKASSGPKKRGRPAAKKGPKGPKLTAACPKCKRAKVRCTHRKLVGDDSSNPVDVDAESQEPSSPPKKRTRIHLKATEPESILSNSPSPERKTRGTRKRKVAETEDPPYTVVEENPTASVSEPAAPKKRRGRKPKNAQPVEIADSPVAVPDTPTETPAPPSFPADSLEGAALLSRHVILSQELQQKLDDCDTKWVAAIKALKEAKEVLDTWVGVWRSGE